MVPAPPQGSRDLERDATHSSPHGRDAGAHVRRSGAYRRRPARGYPDDRPLHVRAPAAAVRRAGRRAGGGADRVMAEPKYGNCFEYAGKRMLREPKDTSALI